MLNKFVSSVLIILHQDVNLDVTQIVLNKVLLVGTKTTTYIGKPVVTNAAVHAVVEDQVIINFIPVSLGSVILFIFFT